MSRKSSAAAVVLGRRVTAVRAPGYEIAYLTGVVQFNQLFADRTEQLGGDFDVREFMDEFFAVGQIPTALIRWQMTASPTRWRRC